MGPNARRWLSKIINSSRRVPVIAFLAARIKRRFPATWRKLATRTKRLIAEPQPEVNIEFEASEDELYFMDLFQSEINKRMNGKR